MNENEKELDRFDPAIQSEDIAFASSQLIDCEKCHRQNPPNRTACLYCGSELDLGSVDIDAVKPSSRPLEDWEPGWNLIVSPESQPVEDLGPAARLLSLEMADLRSIIDSPVPLPTGRYPTETDACLISEKLGDYGIRCSIVSDKILETETQPIRVKKLLVTEGQLSLVDFNTEKSYDIDSGDIASIVSGYIITGRTDLTEKRKRQGRASKVLDEAHVTMDEQVIDIYCRDDRRGFRIQSAGFDFSCLGERMGLIASDNMSRLVDLLSGIAPEARLVRYDRSVRKLLEHVWPTELQKDNQGLVRSGFGKRDFGSSLTTSNKTQFTKFSRLQNTI